MLENILLYAPDPYGIGAARFAVSERNSVKEVSAQQVSTLNGPWLTYDASALIDELRRCNVLPPNELIDVSEAVRLLTGISRADGGERKWDFWRRIKPHFNAETAWRLARAVHEGRGPSWDGINVQDYFASLAAAMQRLWEKTAQALQEAGELARFFHIEAPTAAIFYQRQWHGIGIDKDRVSASLDAAAHRKYTAYQEVAELLRASPTGLNYWNVRPYLARTDLKDCLPSVDGYALRDQLKLARPISKFADSFTEYMDANRDVEILNRLSDSDGRVYPTFHPIGTISSRTLVSDPFLQELRKDFRHVLRADEGKRLIYFDYSQFEPGVMASLSSDNELQALYNGGDVYKALSMELFGSADQRDLCKRVFLAFSYGMSVDGITRLLSNDATERDNISSKVTAFFARFPGLQDFKLDAERHLQEDRYISTLLGNRRLRTGRGALTAKERRWATSHAIQGNASLIFKQALVGIADRFGAQSVLLPMHDAVLMQCTEDDYAAMVAGVTEIMRASFARWCPGIEVRVTCTEFGVNRTA
jgi:DNA polymerase family A